MVNATDLVHTQTSALASNFTICYVEIRPQGSKCGIAGGSCDWIHIKQQRACSQHLQAAVWRHGQSASRNDRFVRRTAPSCTPSISTLAVAIALSLIPTAGGGGGTSPRLTAGLKSGEAMGGRCLGGEVSGRTYCIPKVGEGCTDHTAQSCQTDGKTTGIRHATYISAQLATQRNARKKRNMRRQHALGQPGKKRATGLNEMDNAGRMCAYRRPLRTDPRRPHM